MNIVRHEVKKLFNLKVLILIAVLCALFYLLFLEFYVSHYPNGHPATEMADLMTEITQRYGTTVTAAEIEPFLAQRQAELEAEAEWHIQNNPRFAEAGIHSLADHQAMRQRQMTDEEWDLVWELNDYRTNGIGFRLYAVTIIQEYWDGVVSTLEREIGLELIFNWFTGLVYSALDGEDLSALIAQARDELEGQTCGVANIKRHYLLFLEDIPDSPSETRQSLLYDNLEYAYRAYPQRIPSNFGRQRMIEVLETHQYRGTMDGGAFENTVRYFTYFSAMLMLATLLLISPLVTTDRMRNIHNLQYASKLGRRILKRQVGAALVATFILTTVLLGVFGGIYSTTGVFMYLGHSTTSFHAHSRITLFDMNFGLYLAIIVAMAYVLSLGTALVAFVISRFSRNLITALLKVIPVFVVMFQVCMMVFRSAPLTLTSGLYRRTHVIGIEVMVCLAVLVFALGVALYICWRERQVNVM